MRDSKRSKQHGTHLGRWPLENGKENGCIGLKEDGGAEQCMGGGVWKSEEGQDEVLIRLCHVTPAP